jgi:hypothetical protein
MSKPQGSASSSMNALRRRADSMISWQTRCTRLNCNVDFHKAHFTYLDMSISIIALFYSTRFEWDVFITHLMLLVEICSSQGSGWYVTMYFCGYVHFGGVFCLHLQGRRAAYTVRCRRNVRRKLQTFSPKSYYKVIDCYLVVFILLGDSSTDRMFRNVETWNSDAGESPKRKHTTFRTQRKFEIKIIILFIIMAV